MLTRKPRGREVTRRVCDAGAALDRGRSAPRQGQDRGGDDILDAGAAREVADRAREALKERADGLRAGHSYEE